MRMQARHDVGRLGSSVDVGGVSVGWVVCKLLQSGALVCGCGQRLCGLAWKKVGQRQEKSRAGRRETGSREPYFAKFVPVVGGVVWYWGYGMGGTQHAQATSKEDKIKLEPSVATGCVDGSTLMVWYGRAMVK